MNEFCYLDTAKHAYETKGNSMTHNDDKESHLNILDAQVTHSAFNIKEIIFKPQMKQNNGIK